MANPIHYQTRLLCLIGVKWPKLVQKVGSSCKYDKGLTRSEVQFTKKFSTSHLQLNFNSALFVYFQHINKFLPGPQTI